MTDTTEKLTAEEWERLDRLGMFPDVWGDYVHRNHEGVCTHPSCLAARAIRQLQSENAEKDARIRELEAENARSRVMIKQLAALDNEHNAPKGAFLTPNDFADALLSKSAK